MFNWLRRPALRVAWSVVFVLGGFSGIIFWGGFNTAMEYTNTLEFCISCHEMRDTVYLEWGFALFAPIAMYLKTGQQN